MAPVLALVLGVAAAAAADETTKCDFDIPSLGLSCSVPGANQNCCARMQCLSKHGGGLDAEDKCMKECVKKKGGGKDAEDKCAWKDSECPVLSKTFSDAEEMDKVCHDTTVTCDFELDSGKKCSIPGVKQKCCTATKCFLNAAGVYNQEEEEEYCEEKTGVDPKESGSCPVVNKALKNQDEFCHSTTTKKPDYLTCNFGYKPTLFSDPYKCSIPGVRQDCCQFIGCYVDAYTREDKEKCYEWVKGGSPREDCSVLHEAFKDLGAMGKVCQLDTSRLSVQTQSALVPQHNQYMQHSVLMVGSAGLVGFVVLAVVLRRITTGPATARALEFDMDNEEQMGVE